MSKVTVRPASLGEKDGICRLIGLAFVDDPSTLAIVRGDRRKASRMMEYAARVILHPETAFGHVLVAEREGRLVGAINAVEWPRCQMSKGEMLTTAPTMLRGMGLALFRTLSVAKARAKHEPRKPHWHFGPTAVHPEEQGHGIATELFSSALGLADEQGTPSFAMPATDRALALCEKFDFKVFAEEEIQGKNTRFMWREPQPVAAG